ncbi:MAG: hypothetical protein LC624_03420 [Halobacteriales archaeon]|nr:hypothetical protein [Halobacteriales archaeon]
MRRVLALLLVLALPVTALTAQAHEHVCVKGTTATALTEEGAHCGADQGLEFAVGWRNEPPVTGLLNGLDLGITTPADGKPVENVTTVTAQYETGGQVRQLSLDGQFGKPGWYTDSIIPTKEGQYTVRIGGSVLGHTTSFTVHPEAVDPAGDLMFPVKDPSAGDLNARLTALEQNVDQMKNAAQQGGVNVTPGNQGSKTPGFEPLVVVGALAVALVLVRRR